MNIIAISHEYPPIGGGGANACYNISKEMVKQGHSVTVVTARYQDTPKIEDTNGVCVYRVPALRRKRDKSSFFEMFTFLLSGCFKASYLARKNTYDVCVIYFGIPSGPIGLYLKKRFNIPYIVRFGGGDIPGAQKRFGLIYKLLSPLIRTIWKNADSLIANSAVLKAKAGTFENRFPINVIPNGVDSEYYRRNTEYSCDNGINLLFVSRLIEGKGLQFVIPHIQEIQDRLNKEVTLTIVGDGPYREHLERLSLDSNMDQYISFVGRKDGKELLRCYEEANVFILPSLSEGMPNVVLEAMSMGLPIVMTDCGGSAELIDGNGTIAKVDTFVDAIVELCKSTDRLKECSEVSIKRANELFDWAGVACQYVGM